MTPPELPPRGEINWGCIAGIAISVAVYALAYLAITMRLF